MPFWDDLVVKPPTTPELSEENIGWWVGKGSENKWTSEGWVPIDHYVLFCISKDLCGKIVSIPDLNHQIWLYQITDFKKFTY